MAFFRDVDKDSNFKPEEGDPLFIQSDRDKIERMKEENVIREFEEKDEDKLFQDLKKLRIPEEDFSRRRWNFFFLSEMAYICIFYLKIPFDDPSNNFDAKRCFLYIEADRPEKEKEFVLIFKQALAEFI
jgi:hypothetical protein